MTALGLLSLIIFWLIAGIAFSSVEMSIYGIPIWALVGTLGVWTIAIIIAITLSRNIQDVDL